MDHATTSPGQSPTLILFVAPVNNVLGRVPLFTLFLDSNEQFHIICAISKPMLFSIGPLMQPSLTAGGEATLTR